MEEIYSEDCRKPVRKIRADYAYFSGYFHPSVLYVCTAKEGGVQMEEKQFTQWATEWLEARLAKGLAQNTWNSYRGWICSRFVPRFSDTSLRKMTENEISDYYEELVSDGLSSRTIWCGHLLMRRSLYDACKCGLLEVNPAAQIDILPTPKQYLKRVRQGQVKRYLEEAKLLGAFPILYTILTSGLRQGEATSLQWAAFDVDAGKLYLQKRWVTLTQKQTDILLDEYKKHPKSQLVFIDERTGKPYSEHRLYYLHQKILTKAKLPAIGLRELQVCARGMLL